jgi:hypothetical protein
MAKKSSFPKSKPKAIPKEELYMFTSYPALEDERMAMYQNAGLVTDPPKKDNIQWASRPSAVKTPLELGKQAVSLLGHPKEWGKVHDKGGYTSDVKDLVSRLKNVDKLTEDDYKQLGELLLLAKSRMPQEGIQKSIIPRFADIPNYDMYHDLGRLNMFYNNKPPANDPTSLSSRSQVYFTNSGDLDLCAQYPDLCGPRTDNPRYTPNVYDPQTDPIDAFNGTVRWDPTSPYANSPAYLPPEVYINNFNRYLIKKTPTFELIDKLIRDEEYPGGPNKYQEDLNKWAVYESDKKGYNNAISWGWKNEEMGDLADFPSRTPVLKPEKYRRQVPLPEGGESILFQDNSTPPSPPISKDAYYEPSYFNSLKNFMPGDFPSSPISYSPTTVSNKSNNSLPSSPTAPQSPSNPSTPLLVEKPVDLSSPKVGRKPKLNSQDIKEVEPLPFSLNRPNSLDYQSPRVMANENLVQNNIESPINPITPLPETLDKSPEQNLVNTAPTFSLAPKSQNNSPVISPTNNEVVNLTQRRLKPEISEGPLMPDKLESSENNNGFSSPQSKAPQQPYVFSGDPNYQIPQTQEDRWDIYDLENPNLNPVRGVPDLYTTREQYDVPEAKEKKNPLYSKNDWVIAGLEGASVISGRARGLQQEQAQANLMREVGQRPTYYAGYYDNMNRTTIGRNQGLITASHGARIPSTATGLENALVEKGEYLVYPDGKFREVGGEKHNSRIVNGQEVGGTETILPEGTMVFSEKLKVPGTKKSFSNMAKSLSGKIEDYMEKMNKVGLAKVDKDTAQLMFTKTVKSLNELFELQQSVNGNHGEDYVDTVDPDTGESGEMAIAGNGMIKYGDGAKTPSSNSKTPQITPPKNYTEIFTRATDPKNTKTKAEMLDILQAQGFDISDSKKIEPAIGKADKVNQFLTGLNDYYFRVLGNTDHLDKTMDKKIGDVKRKEVIEKYLKSASFKSLGINPEELGIFTNGSLLKDDNGNYSINSKISGAKQLFDEEGVKDFQKVYRGLYRFNKVYGEDDNFRFNFGPVGKEDQMYEGAPISPVDGWLGNTTIGQLGKEYVVAPAYTEQVPKEPAKVEAPGNEYTPVAPVRPAKYTPRPFDNKQILSNVLAMSQNVAPYAIPEIQDIRVTPYETYIDPAVQDQYTAAMAGSSYGADPNAMFINATANVLKLQADKRNQDANIDYQTRMKNAEFERQADEFNTNGLSKVNNEFLNLAKSNKAENDIRALQSMVEKYQTYQANEARTAMNFPLVSRGYDFDARTMESTLVPGYNEAMMGNLNSTLMNQEGFLIPNEQQYLALKPQEEKKKKSSSKNPNESE